MQDDDKWRKAGRAFRMEGIAFAIPTVLVVFPVVGALLGKLAGQWLGQPWLLALGLFLGLFAGIRECIRLVKLLNRSQKR
jgi:F0F1-type ATP synthase assembly protein I